MAPAASAEIAAAGYWMNLMISKKATLRPGLRPEGMALRAVWLMS